MIDNIGFRCSDDFGKASLACVTVGLSQGHGELS
jgi:hypothetical protein